MTDSELDAWLNASAALLEIDVAPEWHQAVRLHLRITHSMAQRVMEFALPDDADPLPTYHA
jgi:hypothetical protein